MLSNGVKYFVFNLVVGCIFCLRGCYKYVGEGSLIFGE